MEVFFFRQGTGGTYIIVQEVEQITVLNAAGQKICGWTQPGSTAPIIPDLLLLV